MKQWLALSLTLALASASPALAGTPEEDARGLFNEGQALLSEHQYEKACQKFAESLAVYPTGGAVVNLAECKDKSNDPVAALTLFQQAEKLAHDAAKPDIEAFAHKRALEVEAKIGKAAIVVDAAALGQEVRLDGHLIDVREWASPRMIVQGDHILAATAPGHEGIEIPFHVVGRESQDLRIPALVPRATAKPPPPVGPPPIGASPGKGQRIAGGVLMGVGGLGVVVGAVLGGVALATNDDALSHCTNETDCSQTGLDLTDDALAFAHGSTASLVAGGAIAVTGLIVFLTSPRGTPATGTARPPFMVVPVLDAGRGHFGASLMGGF